MKHRCVLGKECLNNEKGRELELLVAASLAATRSLSVGTAVERRLFGDLCAIGPKELAIIHIPKPLSSPD